MIVVSDTSSVSALLRIGPGELLQRLYGEVLIPEAVRAELLAFFPNLPEFLQCRQVRSLSGVARLRAKLDLGEAEAILLARESHADLLLMEVLLGRAVAAQEGIPLIGLMGVLLQAKREGMIGSVRQLVERLETEADFRLSVELKQTTLRRAGEM